MPDLITTKPNTPSIKNERVYRALRRQGYDKTSAARISNAQAKRKRKTYTVADLEQAVLKDYAPAVIDAIARAIPELPRYKGEQIAPGITRIRGELCNVHGRYGRCPGGTGGAAVKPVQKPKRGRAARKPRAPAKTPEQRAAEREQQHAQNRADVLSSFNIAPDGQAALGALRNGEQPPDASTIARHGFVEAGIVERADDGSYRLTSSGRAMLSAADQGDRGRAGATISAARDRTSARTDRRRQAEERKWKPRSRRAAADQQTTKAAGSPGDYLVVEDPQKSSTWHLQVRRGGKADHHLMGGAWAALHGGYRGNTYQGPNKAQALAKLKKLYASEGMDVPTAKAASFRVFKDAHGKWRWVAISSTAYQDRDGEIVSTKALADDVAYADATGVYGPLRWWHVPSLNLGDCDFNALSGRVLIESGTFRSEVIAQKVARAAGDLEVSLGFVHAPTEPDTSGVFHSIRRFERSLTPRGKASNLFTSFHVKETPMDETKKAALKALGFSDSDIADLETRAAQTQKAADDAGVKYKAEEPAPPEEVTIGGVVYTLKAAPVEAATEKAPMAMDAEDMTDQGVDEAAEGEPPLDASGDTGGLTLSAEDLSAIGQVIGEALQGALAQIMGGLDLEKKVAGHVQTLMQPYQAQKDSDTADAKARADLLDTRVKAIEAQQADLLGLQPVNPFKPRASADPETTLKEGDPLLETIREQIPQNGGFDDLFKNLFGGGASALPGA